MPELRLTVEQKSLTRLQHPVSHPGLMSDAEELSLVVMMWRLKVRSADDLHKAAKSVLGDFGARVSHKEAKIQAVKSSEPCSTEAHEIALLEEPRRSIPMLPRPQVLDAAGEFGETAVFRNVYASSPQPVTERHDCPEDLRTWWEVLQYSLDLQHLSKWSPLEVRPSLPSRVGGTKVSGKHAAVTEDREKVFPRAGNTSGREREP